MLGLLLPEKGRGNATTGVENVMGRGRGMVTDLDGQAGVVARQEGTTVSVSAVEEVVTVARMF